MSTLLDEIIAARKAKAIEYEQYLKRIAEIVKQVEAGKGPGTPEPLKSPGQHALYNLLSHGGSDSLPGGLHAASEGALDLALRIDNVVKHKMAKRVVFLHWKNDGDSHEETEKRSGIV